MRRGRSTAIAVAALLVVVFGVNYVPQFVEQVREKREHARLQELEAQNAANQEEYPGPNLEVVGSENAPIQAIFVLPYHKIQKEGVQDVLGVKAWAQKHLDLVNLTITKMKTPEGSEVMRANGINCAGIMINGQYKFRLWDRRVSHSRHVALEKAPGPPGYRAYDVIDVLEQTAENIGKMPKNRTLHKPLPPDAEGYEPAVEH